MICEEWRDKIDAYVDAAQNHASASETAALEEHLRSCPACTAAVLSRTQMKAAVRATAAMRYPAPAELRLRVEKSIRAKSGASAMRVWIPILAAAAVLILAALVSVQVFTRHAARAQMVAQLVDLHVATIASANPVDVVSTDRHTVKPWFQGKLPFTFNLPELDNSPYKLLGGKVVYLDNRPGAQLLFELRKHEISVFITQEGGGGSLSGTLDVRKNGFSLESWSQDKLRYAIVSDAGATEVQGLADLLNNGARP